MLKIRWGFVRVHLQTQLLMLSEFKRIVNFRSSWNHQKTYDFSDDFRGIEINQFFQVRLILEAKFGDTPSDCLVFLWQKCFQAWHSGFIYCLSEEFRLKFCLANNRKNVKIVGGCLILFWYIFCSCSKGFKLQKM